MKTLVYNIKTKSFSSSTHELFELRDGSYKITPMGFNLDLKAKYIMKGTKEECQARKKELEEKNFSNGADSVICIEYFNDIKDSLKAIVNISKLSTEFRHKFTDKDAKEFLNKLASSINYKFNDRSFSVRDAMNSLDREKQTLDKAENSTKPWKDLLVRRANLNIELANLRLNYERYFENYQKKSDRIKSEIDNVEEMIEDAKENQ